jgi:aspartate 1-decarboxylase
MSSTKLNVCLTKIHRATVTDASLDYVGSITIDSLVMKAAGLIPNQLVQINNVANGHPWRTYIIEGEAGKGEIILNGPPAHHFHPGDIVIIWADVWVMPEEAAKMTHPRVVFVDGKNQVTSVKQEGWWPL